MATSILLKFQTLKCDISRTIWRIEVSDGSLFCIFHALSFERNLFFDRTCPLMGWVQNFIYLIKSMYEDLQLSVKLSDGVTPFFDSLLGVRQECNLSPLLFNLFVNDIFQELTDNSCEPIKLQQKDINCLMYGDDLLILSETEAGLNNSLQRLGKYAKRWKLKISQKKTKIMVFNKQGRSIDLKLKIDNLVIESCKKYVYMGIVFTPGNNLRSARKNCIKRPARHCLLILV